MYSGVKERKTNWRRIPTEFLVATDFVYTGVHDRDTCRGLLSFFTSTYHAHKQPDMRDLPYITLILKSINDVWVMVYDRLAKTMTGKNSSEETRGKLKRVKIKIRNVIRYQLLCHYIHVLRRFGPTLTFHPSAVANSESLRKYTQDIGSYTEGKGVKRKKMTYGNPVDIAMGDTAFIIQTYPLWLESNYTEHPLPKEKIQTDLDAMPNIEWYSKQLRIPDTYSLETVVSSVTTCPHFKYEWHNASVIGECVGARTCRV